MTTALFDGSDLTIVVPLWKRTSNLARLLASVDATVPAADVLLVVSADDDLDGMGGFISGVHELDPGGVIYMTTPWGDARVLPVDWPGGMPGDYCRKINAGYLASDRPVIFTGADDIVFTDGWYAAARPLLDIAEESMQVLSGGATLEGPFNLMRENVVGVVGTNDACNPRTFNPLDAGYPHSTHSLVARWYADLGGTLDASNLIYHPGYPHEYCDDELCQVAQHRSMYAHAQDAVVEHHHPMASRAGDDATYQRGRARSREARALFMQRRRRWNPTGRAVSDGITFPRRPEVR